MFNGYKVISVTPAGREKCLTVLAEHLLKLKGIIDEHHFWLNTDNQKDVDYLLNLQKKHPDFFKIIYPDSQFETYNILNIHYFFKYCTDENTIYCRFDDDIVWIDEISSFEDFLKFRIQNPQYFLVFANIINNGLCNHIHQRIGALSKSLFNFNKKNSVKIDKGLPGTDWFHGDGLGSCNWNSSEFCEKAINQNGLFGYNCLNYSWSNDKIALEIHKNFFNNHANKTLNKYKFAAWELSEFERISINCFAWLGRDFKEFSGNVGIHEEMWLSVSKPLSLNKINCIFGNFLVSHYGFNHQHKILDANDVINNYKKLADEIELKKYTRIEDIPEFPRCNINDVLEIQKTDHFIYQNIINKVKLEDFTFVLPIQIDSKFRENNLFTCINALNKICETNVLVIEMDKKSKISGLPKNCKHLFVEQKDSYFSRNKLLNIAYKNCETKFVANFEADCILSPNSLIEACNALRSGYNFAIPYNYFALFMNKKSSKDFIDNNILPHLWKDYHGIEFISEYEKNSKLNWESYTFHNGLCFIFNLKTYKECGFENENLVQHGWDDYEHYLRVKKLGHEIFNSTGIVYHLWHDRNVKTNNWYDKSSNQSKKEFFRICNMTYKELISEIESWEWCK